MFHEGKILLGMLIRMAVGTVGAVRQRAHRSIVLLPPAFNRLTAGFAADCRCGYTVFQRIFNYRLLKPHVLWYLIHSESGDLPFGFVFSNATLTQVTSIRSFYYSFLSHIIVTHTRGAFCNC